jgi:WD40 repeat protein
MIVQAARLERVLGCTACPRSLAVNPESGIIAYPAGSAIVLLNPQTQGRAHLKSPGKCQITCLAWSPCGQFIATGEVISQHNSAKKSTK